jgi:hypothetical protein
MKPRSSLFMQLRRQHGAVVAARGRSAISGRCRVTATAWRVCFIQKHGRRPHDCVLWCAAGGVAWRGSARMHDRSAPRG